MNKPADPAFIWNLCQEVAHKVYSTKPPNDRYANIVARMLFGTAAQESNFKWRRQQGCSLEAYRRGRGGFGLWQIEECSCLDTLHLMAMRPPLLENVCNLLNCDPGVFTFAAAWQVLWPTQLPGIGDLLGCVLARIHYLHVPKPIPETVEEQAVYWKTHFNKPVGSGTVEQYLKNWRELCVPIVGS